MRNFKNTNEESVREKFSIYPKKVKTHSLGLSDVKSKEHELTNNISMVIKLE